MNILHVSTPASWRGGEQQVAYLATALSDAGVRQIVLTVEGSQLSKRLMEKQIPVTTFRSRGILSMSLARKIATLCKQNSIDIIHCHDSHAHSAAVLAAGVFGNPTPVVVSRRVDFAVSANPLSSRKYNHPIVKRIICVSDTIRQITAPAIKDKKKLVVVYSGIDLSLYAHKNDRRKLHEELGLSPDAILIGNLSALADHKDYPTFIRTAKNVLSKRENVHFIIAGSGREEKNIRKLISELGLEKNIHLLGFRNDPVNVMQSLDVFLITSVTEGLGTIVLEAFAAGVPVVATRAGGIPEMVEDGVTGLLADIKDTDALSTAVLQILDDSSLRTSLILNAQKRVLDFAYQVTAQKTFEIYKEVIDRR